MSLIIDRATGEEWDEEFEACHNCGESDADLCDCVDCGTGLCCDCAVGGRCDTCDCGNTSYCAEGGAVPEDNE